MLHYVLSTVRLTDFDLELGKDCSYDDLRVYDGSNQSARLLIDPLCGRMDDIPDQR